MMGSIGRNLSLNLKRLRAKRNWTQEMLAAEAGVSQEFVQLVEGGNRWPRKAFVEKLAIALGVQSAQLFADPDAKMSVKEAAKTLKDCLEVIPDDVLELLTQVKDWEIIRAALEAHVNAQAQDPASASGPERSQSSDDFLK